MKRSGPVLVFGLFLAALLLFAMFSVPQAGTMPGQLGYRFKPLKEAAQRALLGAEDRGKFDLDLAARRVAELELEFALRHGGSYIPLVERFEAAYLSAANASLASDVVETGFDVGPRFERMRDAIWDPPFQKLFERARLNTVKGQRMALAHLPLERQGAEMARAEWHHLSRAVASPPILADAELLRYQGWAEYHRVTALALNDSAFDNLTLLLLQEQFPVLQELAMSDIRQVREHGRQVWHTTLVFQQEVRARLPVEIENATTERPAPEPVGPEEPAEPVRLQLAAVLINSAMEPVEVSANLSQQVELSLTAEDKTYSVSVSSLGITLRNIPLGTTSVLAFNATQRGAFPVKCAGYCTSPNYGTIRVE